MALAPIPTNLPPEELELEDELVDTQISRITSEGSPVLTEARLRAQNTAARRGLRNSSIAAGAGERAVIQEARAIGSQNASQIAARNRQAIAARDNTAATEAQFGFNERLNQQQIEANTARDAAAVTAQQEINQQQFGFNQTIQQTDIEARAAQQIQSDTAALERLGVSVDADQARAILSANTQLQLNTNNLSAQERFQTGNFMLETDRNYTNALNAIANNPDIPASERARLQRNALAIRDAGQELIEGLYSTQFTWPTSSSSANATSTTATTPVPTPTVAPTPAPTSTPVPTQTPTGTRTTRPSQVAGRGRRRFSGGGLGDRFQL